jgi:uncharacterized protein YjeT (DUF2065 family)
MSWVFWIAFVFVIVGLGLSIYAAVKALNSAFSPNEDHVLFWIGIILTSIGVGMLLYIAFSNNSKINKLNSENIKLYRMVSECKMGTNPSSPGMWSRFKGWFSRNSSVSPAGNPGEVNPFKNQESSS